jgi:hypothetical protein
MVFSCVQDNTKYSVNDDGLITEFKSDSLYSGHLITDNLDDLYRGNFKNGIPVGEWVHTHRNEVVCRGRYISNDILLDSIKAVVNNDVIALSYWHEGEMKSKNNFLRIEVVNKSFSFKIKKRDFIEIETLIKKYNEALVYKKIDICVKASFISDGCLQNFEK